MVAQKITCPSRSDDIGNQYNSNTKRYGFFSNESQDSQYFESGRNRSFKGSKESAGERYDRSSYRQKRSVKITIASCDDQLFRGKEYLKPEPEFQSTMIHESNFEFYQDLVQWCGALPEALEVQSTETPKYTEDRAHNTDTLHTPFSPQGWDVIDANSPSAHASFYNLAHTSVSPPGEMIDSYKTDYLLPHKNEKVPFEEEFVDIDSLPVLIGDLASVKATELVDPWDVPAPIGWLTHDTEHTKNIIHNTTPFIEEDSLDMKLVSVIPREVESNDVVISEYIINDNLSVKESESVFKNRVEDSRLGLSLDVVARAPNWPGDIISTPEVLGYVEQLENEKCALPSPASAAPDWSAHDTSIECVTEVVPSLPMDFEPMTPKTECPVDSDTDDVKSYTSRKRRRDSEDSDETYTPYEEHSPRKYRRRKPGIPIKDMIRALEDSQQLKPTRRGRPPKRRESTVSSVCSVDENSSAISTHEVKYRELRDKNNEASKRSRMNRKLKELQMEQLALDLEERNKKLRVRAEILEDMTKKLRKAFMSAVGQKRPNS